MGSTVISNHDCAKLSHLDLCMAEAVPPGGNWRNIPTSIPSARLEQIRVSCAAGEGSRSTYYGRLDAGKPAYTIGTYYNRPGNGCFLHYDFEGGQHRTISHREAARLQSFPDSFTFSGSQRAVCQQIGNAVPPLLAFQIANAVGPAGIMIDVFAGAGGLSLGFDWAGWKSIAAVDNDQHAVATFNSNLASVAFVGDMNEDVVLQRLMALAPQKRRERLALVGGPPCQGFSTGGNSRSKEDIRNSLYKRYALLLGRLKPDVFVFENVTGLLSLQNGEFVQSVLAELRAVGYEVALWRLNAARFGVPQRRERVIIAGVPRGTRLPSEPTAWTRPTDRELIPSTTVCGVADALGDLPPLIAGQDGSTLPYRYLPESDYQAYARGTLSAADYIARAGFTDDTGGRSGHLRRVAGRSQRLHAG